tara:strand:- start:588 stop:761 length:174 start_codon:yes stop_codon:yes gene_type:complete
LELELQVFKTVTDVDASKFILVVLVVEVISWPDETSSEYGFSLQIVLEIPAASWLIA